MLGEVAQILRFFFFFYHIGKVFSFPETFCLVALFTSSNNVFPQQCSSNSTLLSYFCYLLESTQTYTIQHLSVSSHLKPHLLTPRCTSQAHAAGTPLHLRSRSIGSPSSLKGKQKEGRTACIVLPGLALEKSHISRLTLGETKRW